jgi:hypothetical protein
LRLLLLVLLLLLLCLQQGKAPQAAHQQQPLRATIQAGRHNVRDRLLQVQQQLHWLQHLLLLLLLLLRRGSLRGLLCSKLRVT